ncbi:MAG: carboxypeptidase-like regulatory domain-containing protein [Acidobacteriaceae bacterium]
MTRFPACALLALATLGFSPLAIAQTTIVLIDGITEPSPPPPPIAQPDTPPEKSATLSGPATFSISGAVVSATTGTPLDRAEVSLSTSGPRGSQLAESITTENGSFRFDHLQAGKYRLEASRRGYITAGYQDHDGFFTGVVIGPNLNTDGLRLQLLPTAIIGGVVTDDAGEPVGGAQVHLFRLDQYTGEGKIGAAGQDTTDDTGTYEFDRLKAGTYYVGVSAAPWYAFHPARKTDPSGNPLPDDQQPHSPLDVAYATTFYENATDSASASAIALNAGDRDEVDLSMHAVPAIHIQVNLRIAEQASNRGIVMPTLAQEVFGEPQMQPGGVTWTSIRGESQQVGEFGGIAPGHYLLRQFEPMGSSDGPRTAAVDLTTNQVVDFAAASVSGVDVSGKVVMASGAKLPNRTLVSLVPADPGSSREFAVVDADGNFALHNVPPGRYDVQPSAAGAQLAIALMAANGADSEGSHITVAGDPVLLAATLASGSTTVTGFAQRDGKPLGGAMILLVPRDPNASRQLDRRDQSNSDGSFSLAGVIPGSYILVAIEDGWTLEWERPEVIAPYLSRGVAVRVTGQKSLSLPTAVEVQPR